MVGSHHCVRPGELVGWRAPVIAVGGRLRAKFLILLVNIVLPRRKNITRFSVRAEKRAKPLISFNRCINIMYVIG